jgi:hypothetical protein
MGCNSSNLTTINKKYDTIINWKSKTISEKYHWWPMQEKLGNNGYLNNLYNPNSGLGKYDKLFDTKSVEYQKKKYFFSVDSLNSSANWSGFCDKAAILSCLYQYPINDVKVKYKNKNILFRKHDIEALMIVSVDNSICNNISMFFGKRNYNNKTDEPYPSELIKILKIISNSKDPFIMDIDNTKAVWNFSYDNIIINKHKHCDLNHDVPNEGITDYYNFIITSIAYPKYNLNLWGYINKKDCNKEYNIQEIKEKWITDIHPDFVWKVYPKNTNWIGKSKINPEIDTSFVYLLYKTSLKNKINEKELILNLDDFNFS